MTTLNDQERALVKAAEDLANAAQEVIDEQPEALTGLVKALHSFRVGQVLVDKAMEKELDALSRRHDHLLTKAHIKIHGN